MIYVLLGIVAYLLIGTGFVWYAGHTYKKNEKVRAVLDKQQEGSGLEVEKYRTQLDHIFLLGWPLLLVVTLVSYSRDRKVINALKREANVALQSYVDQATTPSERQYRKNYIKYAKKQLKLHAKRSTEQWSNQSSQ